MDLIEELRAADPAAVSRCLVITGGTANAGPGGPAVLTKPFRAADLLDAVRALQQAVAPQREPSQRNQRWPEPPLPEPRRRPEPGAGRSKGAGPEHGPG